MKILYDYQAFLFQKYGGISRSFAELISHFPPEVTYCLALKESDNIYVKEYGFDKNVSRLSKTVDNFLLPIMFKGKGRIFDLCNKIFPYYPSSLNINRNYSIESIKKQDYDVFHPTFFDDYFLRYLGGKPFVLTIHDMITELYPQYFNTNDFQVKNKFNLAKQATAIVAVSQYTKDKIVDIFGIQQEKIFVIHHGYNNNIDFDLIRKETPIISSKYFLYMGLRASYKNFDLFITEMAKILKEHSEYKLVCTGLPFTLEESKLIRSLNISNQVIHYFASSHELNNLLVNAEAFIYPSLDEGFGMPILEAFAAGCPVLLNNKSCFPEVAGNAALYFNLDKHGSDFYQCISSFISYSSGQINSLQQLGYERLSLFSWEKSATQLVNLYKELC